MERNSRLSGFYKLAPSERAQAIAAFAGLDAGETELLGNPNGLGLEQADRMIENVVGVYGLPLGMATNFTINGRDYVIPMVIEEPSVVAGLSYAARLVREGGGFTASSDDPVMIGQMQILDLADPAGGAPAAVGSQSRAAGAGQRADPVLARLGGGARDIEVRLLAASPVGPMLVLHLLYDVRDAMGANAVNTAVEALTPQVERISGGRVAAAHPLEPGRPPPGARARGGAQRGAGAGGTRPRKRACSASWRRSAFAAADPYRAATHNKGIMNGIDAVVIATGNDWRAIEAGAHAYAARTGRYTALSTWERDADGRPRRARSSCRWPWASWAGRPRCTLRRAWRSRCWGCSSARELAQVAAAVGLAQNLAAIRALAMEGIQRGHMRLHARQVAMAAGATGEWVERVAQRWCRSGPSAWTAPRRFWRR